MQKGKHPFDTSSRDPSKSFTFSEKSTSQRLKIRINEVTCKNSANDFYICQSNLIFPTDNYLEFDSEFCYLHESSGVLYMNDVLNCSPPTSDVQFDYDNIVDFPRIIGV